MTLRLDAEDQDSSLDENDECNEEYSPTVYHEDLHPSINVDLPTTHFVLRERLPQALSLGLNSSSIDNLSFRTELRGVIFDGLDPRFSSSSVESLILEKYKGSV